MIHPKIGILSGAAFAAVLALSAPAAFSAGDDAKIAPHAGAASASDSTGIKAGQIRASKLIGATVYDKNNQKIGGIEDVVLNPSGDVAAVVVSVGTFLGMGGKDVAVGMSDIATRGDRLVLDRTKSQLQAAASYQLTDERTGAGRSAAPGGVGHEGSSMPPSRQ